MSNGTTQVKLPDPSQVSTFVAKHRQNVFFRKVAGACRLYLSWYGNCSYDVRTNGESFVLETVSRFQPRVIFDVGANIGDWSKLAVQYCPNAQIHAFEIAKPTYESLVKNTKGFPHVRCNQIGLSNEAKTISIRYYNDLPELTTITVYPHPFQFTEMSVDVIAGDTYVEQQAIDHIDFLKLDVEGMEDQVLQGFEKTLARRAVDVIQFEYGRGNILTRFLLRDFYNFFRDRGYLVGKVFPTYVDFRDYDLADEDFVGPNYLACREDKRDFVQVFSAGRVVRKR